MIATLLAAGTLAIQTCASCTLAKDHARLCAPHAEEERAAFARARKALVSKLETERVAALEALSRLTGAHVNAPSEKVARRIADALADESDAVRERAANLLGPPQHALVCLDSLLEALSAAERQMERLRKDEKSLRKKSTGPRPSEKERKQLDADLASNERAQESLLAWRRTVLARLGLFRDERVVSVLRDLARPVIDAPAKARETEDALEAFLELEEAREKLPSAMDLNAPLVRLGNREAVQTVIENLTALQAEVADLERSRSSLSGTTVVGLKNMTEARLRQLRESAERTTQEIASALSERASSAPPPERFQPSTLLEWLEKNVESFPERLPGIDSPAW